MSFKTNFWPLGSLVYASFIRNTKSQFLPDGEANFLRQLTHWNVLKFSWTILTWRESAFLIFSSLLQIRHWKVSEFWWTFRRWFSSFGLVSNSFSQTLHEWIKVSSDFISTSHSTKTTSLIKLIFYLIFV